MSREFMTNSSFEFDCSAIVLAVLSEIDKEIGDLCKMQSDGNVYESPFWNTGASFQTDTFSVEAEQFEFGMNHCNFKWNGIEIQWYKHFRNNARSNIQITPTHASIMLEECVSSIKLLELKHRSKAGIGHVNKLVKEDDDQSFREFVSALASEYGRTPGLVNPNHQVMTLMEPGFDYEAQQKKLRDIIDRKFGTYTQNADIRPSQTFKEMFETARMS